MREQIAIAIGQFLHFELAKALFLRRCDLSEKFQDASSDRICVEKSGSECGGEEGVAEPGESGGGIAAEPGESGGGWRDCGRPALNNFPGSDGNRAIPPPR